MSRIESVASRTGCSTVSGTPAADAAGFPGTADTFDALIGEEYALLVTLRRSGEPVPTPVWFGLRDSCVYVESLADAGKVKRLRQDQHVRVAPCTLRGKPTGPFTDGVGRILAAAEEQNAEHTGARSALRLTPAPICEAREPTRGAVGLPQADTHRARPRLKVRVHSRVPVASAMGGKLAFSRERFRRRIVLGRSISLTKPRSDRLGLDDRMLRFGAVGNVVLPGSSGPGLPRPIQRGAPGACRRLRSIARPAKPASAATDDLASCCEQASAPAFLGQAEAPVRHVVNEDRDPEKRVHRRMSGRHSIRMRVLGRGPQGATGPGSRISSPSKPRPHGHLPSLARVSSSIPSVMKKGEAVSGAVEYAQRRVPRAGELLCRPQDSIERNLQPALVEHKLPGLKHAARRHRYRVLSGIPRTVLS